MVSALDAWNTHYLGKIGFLSKLCSSVVENGERQSFANFCQLGENMQNIYLVRLDHARLLFLTLTLLGVNLFAQGTVV